LSGEGIEESNHAGSRPVWARCVAYPSENSSSGDGARGLTRELPIQWQL
jgi:hypothetical protein